MPAYVEESRFEDHLSESDSKYKDISSKLAEIQKELGTKVSWAVFWSIFVLTIGLFTTTFGILYSAVNDIKKDFSQQGNDVSYIRGVLDRAEITR